MNDGIEYVHVYICIVHVCCHILNSYSCFFCSVSQLTTHLLLQAVRSYLHAYICVLSLQHLLPVCLIAPTCQLFIRPLCLLLCIIWSEMTGKGDEVDDPLAGVRPCAEGRTGGEGGAICRTRLTTPQHGNFSQPYWLSVCAAFLRWLAAAEELDHRSPCPVTSAADWKPRAAIFTGCGYIKYCWQPEGGQDASLVAVRWVSNSACLPF